MTTILPSRGTAISVTTADPTGILLSEIQLRYPSGAADVVHTYTAADGAAFRFPYSSLSTRTEVDPGKEYTHSLRRVGGWPFAFELFVRVIDLEGNESTETYPYHCPAVAPPTGTSSTIGRRVGSDLTDEDGTPTATITDHAGEAQAHLIQYFTGRPRIDAILASWGTQNQELETALWALFTQRGISSAAGVQLDELGAIVGEPRQDRLDAAYRAAIRVRVLVNRSKGTAPELITIARRMAGDLATLRYSEHYPASILFEVHGSVALPQDVARMLRQAKAGGVRMDVIASSALGTAFWHATTPLDTSVPAADAAHGYGHAPLAASVPATGGLYAAVL